ncbi:MAG: hypothetical protein JRJ84_11840 [Deltaproteobacteria bacterium]|nr:hypothetical protein [Deltaproteobacteria bacterium]
MRPFLLLFVFLGQSAWSAPPPLASLCTWKDATWSHAATLYLPGTYLIGREWCGTGGPRQTASRRGRRAEALSEG